MTTPTFQQLSEEIGKLLEEKDAAYGSAFDAAGDFLKLLYPEGVKPEQLNDALCLVRIFDKMKRIATNKDAFGESPYRDIAGYALLGLRRVEAMKDAAKKPESTNPWYAPQVYGVTPVVPQPGIYGTTPVPAEPVDVTPRATWEHGVTYPFSAPHPMIAENIAAGRAPYWNVTGSLPFTHPMLMTCSSINTIDYRGVQTVCRGNDWNISGSYYPEFHVGLPVEHIKMNVVVPADPAKPVRRFEDTADRRDNLVEKRKSPKKSSR